jgi:hypothetical protein
MRFNCEFFDGEDEIREIAVSLNAAECESIKGVREHEGTERADLIAQAMALRHAYGEVPKGFLHTSPPQEIWLS